jgi:hypothetical protein
MLMGDVMKNDTDEFSGDQFYNAFIAVDKVIYGEQDLIPWDEPEHYKVEDLKLDVV